MSSSGYLIHPTVDDAQEKLWIETWKRLDRFLPDLKAELALDAPVEEPKLSAESPAAPASATETTES